MPLDSDITVTAAKFDRSLIDEKTQEFNKTLIHLGQIGPKWQEVGAAEYRKLRSEGKTVFPKPTLLPEAITGTIPSRDPGREIPYRLFKPSNGVSKGAYLHIHGGGWVLNSEASQDPYLKDMADMFGLTIWSVGYRLAPEDKWPACAHDCYDAAEWLVDNAEKEYGGPLMFVSGESAGGHLSSLVVFHLLEARPKFTFRGALLHFGAYDVAGYLPHARNHELKLVISLDSMVAFTEALFGDMTAEERRDPSISPLYKDLRGLKLPPALFTCGSEDPLLDDTVFMGSKWAMWGNESVIKIYNGAPHGFIVFPKGAIKAVEEALEDSRVFVEDKMRAL